MCGVLLSFHYAERPLEKIWGGKDKLLATVIMPAMTNGESYSVLSKQKDKFENS